jgi:hypothetical protein
MTTNQPTRTRLVDSNGNVSYRIEADGKHLGDVLKMCSGYMAETPGGAASGNLGSIRRSVEWLQRLARPSAQTDAETAHELGRAAYDTLPTRAPAANADLMALIGDGPVGDPRTVALMQAYSAGWDAAADAACAAILAE